MRSGISFILVGALALGSNSAMAGIVFLPSGGHYHHPELAPVNLQHLDDNLVRVRTSGLGGELSLEGSRFPPEYGVPANATRKLPTSQVLDLVIDFSALKATGDVHAGIGTGVDLYGLLDIDAGAPLVGSGPIRILGLSSGQVQSRNFLAITYDANVRGSANCLPLNGRDCGQLVIELELRGMLSDPNDPTIVGQITTRILGSLVWADTHVAHWAAMSSDTTLAGNEELIELLSTWIGDANLDGE